MTKQDLLFKKQKCLTKEIILEKPVVQCSCSALVFCTSSLFAYLNIIGRNLSIGMKSSKHLFYKSGYY